MWLLYSYSTLVYSRDNRLRHFVPKSNTKNGAKAYGRHSSNTHLFSTMAEPKAKKMKTNSEKNMALQRAMLSFDLHSAGMDMGLFDLDSLNYNSPSCLKQFNKARLPPPIVRKQGNIEELLQMIPPEVLKEAVSLLDDVNNTPEHYQQYFNSLLAKHAHEEHNVIFKLLREEFKLETLQRINQSAGSGWLDDIAISFYQKLLKVREEYYRDIEGETHENTHVFDTRRTEYIENKGPDYVLGWMWKHQVNITKCRRLIFIFQQGLTHYIVVSVDLATKTVTPYDPMGGAADKQARCVVGFLKRLESGGWIPKGNGKQWKIGRAPPETPKQADGRSCGVFSCLYANLLSRGICLQSLHTCHGVPHYRAHIGALIACLHKGANSVVEVED